MRQSMTIRLDQEVLSQARSYAESENRTLTNYIETLIKIDLNAKQARVRDLSRDTPVKVFIAEPMTRRLITNPRANNTHEEVTSRQDYLDMISGWAK